MFQSPGAIAFTLGNTDIHWYGLVMSFAILIGIFVIIFTKKRFYPDISTDTICDISFMLIICGIISARLYYVILDYKYFIKFPLEIPAVWHGGISIQGAIIGGIIAGLIYAKKKKINFLRYADLYSFGIVTGQIIGRWGNFFNSEAFGLPTDLPWKLYIPYKSRPMQFRAEEYFHPAFLYESLLSIIILIILYLILVKYKKRTDGLIFFCYIILYSIARIIVESIRVDSVLNINNIHIAHITAFLFIVAGIIGIIYINKHDKKRAL